MAALLLLLLPASGHAQDTAVVPPVTRTFALTNARIVQAPGRVIERGTVVVRDGLIEAVGTNVAIPFDAERIAADSLVVYAGFIDGLSHVGVPRPKTEDQNRERVPRPGDPPNDRAGIQPERDVRTLLNPEDPSVEALRKAGFTVAHTVPYGQMLPGSGAVVMLAGADANAMTLRGDASLFFQFDGARGVYPATPMGVIAKMRQLYREAARRRDAGTLYASNQAGLERPPQDAVHNAFFPVIAGTKPVFVHTDGALETFRALALQRELGFRMVLAGLDQAFVQVDELKAAKAPLFLTLALPKEPKAPAKADSAKADSAKAEPVQGDSARVTTPEIPGSFFMSDLRTQSYKDLDAEKKNLEARQRAQRDDYVATAARLHAAGVRFGFSTKDVKPEDVAKNLRAMVKAGLPEEAALAALTVDAAEQLGLGQSLGTVEPGKIANLVVTSRPFFDEKSQVRFVFVDGQKFEYEARKAPAPGTRAQNGGNAATPLGTWSYSVSTPQGDVGGELVITGSPGAYAGTISNEMSPGGTLALSDVAFDGSTLSFTFLFPQMGRLSVTATLQGDTLEGSIDVPGMGAAPLTGRRTARPN